MTNEVDLARPIGVPQVDGQDVKRRVDLVDVDLFLRHGILHDQANTRWRGDRSSILRWAIASEFSCPTAE